MTRDDRRFHQRKVSALLGKIGARVDELERLRARGVRGRALSAIEAEITDLRERLAAVVRGEARTWRPQ